MLPISDVAMISFGYSDDYASHIKTTKQIHYTDNSMETYSDDTKDIIDNFKRRKKISTYELNYNGKFYTPILNGELKCASINKCSHYLDSLDLNINTIDINNKKVVVLESYKEGQNSYRNKCLLYSAKTNYNYLALVKCRRNYCFKSALDNFESIRNNYEHQFNKLMHDSSYKDIAKVGMYPGDTSILCHHCNFNIKYDKLTQKTSNPIKIIALHNNFINKMPTKDTFSSDDFKYCPYNVQTHNNDKFNHYHEVCLDKLTIKDILKNIDSKMVIYIYTSTFYFGKFNLETLDQSYLQDIQNLSIQGDITAETVF
jgi:hypothetical protein